MNNQTKSISTFIGKCALLVFFGTAAASANVTYTYHGSPVSLIPSSSPITLPTGDAFTALNGDFVMSSPIPANQTENITPIAYHFSFDTLGLFGINYNVSNGMTFEIGNANPISAITFSGSNFLVTTDSQGNIVSWNIFVIGTNGSTNESISTENFNLPNIPNTVGDTVEVQQLTYSFSAGAYTAGNWTTQTASAPLPSAIIFLISGLIFSRVISRRGTGQA